MRHTARALVATAVVALVGGGTLPIAVESVAAATATVAVTPSTGLAPGQTVAVHAEGLTPGQNAIVQCGAAATDLLGCDGTTFAIAETAADGTVDADFVVHRRIVPSTGQVDCGAAPGACTVVIGRIGDLSITAGRPVSFDPNAPGPTPTVTATPASGLVDGQTVTVAGAGFDAGASVEVYECATGQVCTGASLLVTAGADGTMATSLVVRTRATTNAGSVVDCLPPGACALVARDAGNPDALATVALGFDPAAPRAVPAVTVDPATGLVDRQSIAVTATGFDPNVIVSVAVCPAALDAFCRTDTGQLLFTDAAGSFSGSLTVRRVVSPFGPDPALSTDCAVAACAVRASQLDGSGLVASTPVAFDPAVPPAPPPVVTATPSTGLGYRDVVRIQGSGFVGGHAIDVTECASSGNSEVCFSLTTASSDATGAFSIPVAVRRTANFGLGDSPKFDCADASTSCSLRVSDQQDPGDRADLPLAFDPNAVPPPPPIVTVEPTTALGDRAAVDVHASGFVPGDTVFVTQCQAGQTAFGFCGGVFTAVADEHGEISTALRVHRMLTNGAAPAIDCAAAPGTCVVTVSTEFTDESAQAPLTFDPNAPPAPPPSLTITPAIGLAAGDTVTVTGSGFDSAAQIGFTLCGAGTPSLDRCAITQAQFVTADASGSFTGQLTITDSIQTSVGPFACAFRPGTCTVGAANLSDYGQNAFVPVSLGPEVAATAAVTEDGTAATVTVSLSRPATRDAHLAWSTVDGSAVAGEDYVTGSGALDFAPGETTKTIPIALVAGRDRDESSEFFVDLTDPAGVSVAADPTRVAVELPATGPGPGEHHHHGHHHHDHDDDHHHDHDHWSGWWDHHSSRWSCHRW